MNAKTWKGDRHRVAGFCIVLDTSIIGAHLLCRAWCGHEFMAAELVVEDRLPAAHPEWCPDCLQAAVPR